MRSFYFLRINALLLFESILTLYQGYANVRYMKSFEQKYPTTYGPKDKLPAHGLVKSIRLGVTPKGRAHQEAVTNEGYRRYLEQRASKEAAVATPPSEPLNETPINPQPERKAPNRLLSRTKVLANLAISGSRNSPFENVQTKRPMTAQRKRTIRVAGAVAAAAVGVAGISAGAVVSAKAVSSYEATQSRINAEQQKALEKVVQPKLNRVGKYVFTAFSGWEKEHPSDTTTYTENHLPDDMIEIIANNSNNEAIMGTKLVDGERVADPSNTVYAHVNTEGNGTMWNQYDLANPAGTQFVPSGTAQGSIGSNDYYEAFSGPGLDGVMSLEDTTTWNDAVLGGDFTSPAALAQDINQNQGVSGLDGVIGEWQQNPQLVNSLANPE
jgi:hypothetical protein